MSRRHYEIPISPNYVHNWTIREAVRELLQNAIDGEKCGYKKTITYDEAKKSLSIKNDGVSLNVSTLVLGGSEKQDNDDLIGHYGEGYKLALVVLLREGRTITIHNGNKTWLPSFKYSNKFATKVLNIAEQEATQGNYIEFVIHGISEQEYRNLLVAFPCMTADYGHVVESENGTILLDKRFEGKMFVEGLYVQSDDNFQYGYNFKASVVSLDRDRRAINYYELRKLTASAVVTAEICSPEIFYAISESCTDVRDIKEVIDEASTEFLESYYEMLKDDRGLSEDTLIATKAVAKQLRQMDKSIKVVEGNEIESYLVAKTKDKLGLIKEAKVASQKRSDVERGWCDLEGSSFLKLMGWYTKNKWALSKDAIEEFENEIRPEFEPATFHYIEKYIPKDFPWTDESLEQIKTGQTD